MDNKSKTIVALGAVLLMGGTAAATMYLADRPATTATAPAKTRTVVHRDTAPAPQPVRNTACKDGNIVGKAVGGVGGGVAGSMVGKGKGKTAATIGGTLGGAYLGGEVLPFDNVTCP